MCAGFARRPWIEVPGRATRTARVDAQADVAVWHPFLRIDQFPHLVRVGRAFSRLGKSRGHALPCALVAFLEGEALAERAIGKNDRVLPVVVWSEDIGAQHDAVVHRDGRIPVDAHAVAHLALGRLELSIHRLRSLRRLIAQDGLPGALPYTSRRSQARGATRSSFARGDWRKPPVPDYRVSR